MTRTMAARRREGLHCRSSSSEDRRLSNRRLKTSTQIRMRRSVRCASNCLEPRRLRTSSRQSVHAKTSLVRSKLLNPSLLRRCNLKSR
jgi:hypothetical protein